MKKIVIISTSLRGGGAERVMLNLANNIDRTLFNISLIFIDKTGDYEHLVPSDLNVIDLKQKRLKKATFKLIKEINKIKPDLIITTMHSLNLLALLIRPFLISRPKIVIRFSNTPYKPTNTSKLRKLIEKRVFSTADKIIVQCDEMKEDVVDFHKIKTQKLKRIYNPVDREYIIKKSRKENPFNKAKVNVLAVGRLVEQKGYDILIRAIEQVKSKVTNIHLTIIGQGPLEEELKKLVNQLNMSQYITFRGFVDNPFPFYKYSDLYVLSSRYEGFPNSLLEAITLGTNVVSTKCKSGPSEILKNGKIGTLVNVDSVLDLAEGIIHGLSKNEKEILKNRSKDFDIMNIIPQYESLIIELITQKKS